MADATIRVNADTREAERALGNLQRALGALGVGVSIAAFAKFADEVTNTTNKLKVATLEYGNFGRAQEDIIRISKATGVSLAATGDLYSKLNMSLGEMGYSQASVMRVTETFQKAMVAGGVATQQAQAAVLQFGQAIASGRLGGDEFRSLAENAPYFMNKLRQSLGLTQAQFRQMAEEGRLTPDIIIPAMRRMASSVDSDAQTMTKTIGQAAEILRTSLAVEFDKLDTKYKITETISNAIIKLSENLDKAAVVAAVFVGTLALAKIVGTVIQLTTAIRQATTAMAVFNAVVGKNPIVKIAAVLAGVAGTIMAMQDDQSTSQDEINAKLAERNKLDEIAIANEKIKKMASADQLKAYKELENSIRKMTEALSEEQLKSVLPPEAIASRKAVFEEEEKLRKVNASLNADQKKRIENIVTQTELAKRQNAEFERQRGIVLGLAQQYDGDLTKAVKNYQYALEQTRATNISDPKMLEDIQKGFRVAQEQLAVALRSTTLGPDYAAGLKASQDYYAAIAEIKQLYDQQVKIGNDQLLLDEQARDAALTTLHENFLMTKLRLDQEYAARATAIREAQIYEELKNSKDNTIQQALGQQGLMDAAKKRAEFEKKTDLEKTQFAIDQGAQLFTALGQYNKQAFQAAKAFNIANAIMNTYMAATKALASFPPPFSFIAAGAAVAMGLAQVASIRSQQYSGRAIGGPVASNTPYIVGENGPEMFVPQGAGKVVPNNQLDTGPVNISFTINTVDARGMDQLLMERKGMIVGMVRSAINDRGLKAPM